MTNSPSESTETLDEEWKAHRATVFEYTDDLDQQLRQIIQYAQSGKFYPAHMHVELIKEAYKALIDTQVRLARIEELVKFKERLDNNHHDMPIGTPSQYVTEQMLERINELKNTKRED